MRDTEQEKLINTKLQDLIRDANEALKCTDAAYKYNLIEDILYDARRIDDLIAEVIEECGACGGMGTTGNPSGEGRAKCSYCKGHGNIEAGSHDIT